mmetsp:Transcript_4090/g.10194  ORF Transcript_4090/g.10194 Transcript_4090/m.10194 type:complete len:240 (+) Transcript_4090:157-876(+)
MGRWLSWQRSQRAQPGLFAKEGRRHGHGLVPRSGGTAICFSDSFPSCALLVERFDRVGHEYEARPPAAVGRGFVRAVIVGISWRSVLRVGYGHKAGTPNTADVLELVFRAWHGYEACASVALGRLIRLGRAHGIELVVWNVCAGRFVPAERYSPWQQVPSVVFCLLWGLLESARALLRGLTHFLVGSEAFPRLDPAIVIGNHQSSWHGLNTFAALPGGPTEEAGEAEHVLGCDGDPERA